MVYVKSALAGFLALIVAFVATICGVIVYGVTHKPTDGSSIGWDPISLFKHPIFPSAVVVLIFVAGFFWEFRRLTHR